MRSQTLSILLLLVMSTTASRAAPVTIDIPLGDGTAMKGVYTPGSAGGAGIVLLHQCDMDRRAWDGLTAALAARGIHSLTFDYRGIGENRALNADYARLPSDFDAAVTSLQSQPGVDRSRIAAGGASCGVDHAVRLAKRTGHIRALVLLSGPTDDEGLAYIRTSRVPVFLAFSANEGGPMPAMKSGVAASLNPATTVKEFRGAGHGVPMFGREPALLPDLVDWVVTVLR